MTYARAAVVVISILLSGVVMGSSEPPAVAMAASPLAGLTSIIEKEIADGRIPGALVEIGQGNTLLYRDAVGWRAMKPELAPMTVNTVFDLASLTKVVATATAVMQLVERGRLDLNEPVSAYWPRFASHGKGAITIRDLLTHYAGLRPDLDMRSRWSGYQTAMQKLVHEKSVSPPGTEYIYSDENFAVLGEIVRRVSGLRLDIYCERYIFEPLQMRHTRFRPPADVPGVVIAPTMLRDPVSRAVAVHDPMAARMGGVSGHAGLFSTADDLARFARMLLNGGELDGVRVLQSASIAAASSPQSPMDGQRRRGLGWDLAQPSSNVALPLPPRSSGHTGYTGTLIGIDPASGVYAIILTNRTYPDGRGDAQPLRDEILARIFGMAD